MKNEIANEVVAVAEPNKKCGLIRKAVYGFGALATAASMSGVTALAIDLGDVTVKSDEVDADQMMGKVIGMVLLIARYVGIALVIYGVYEVVMSFLQNQPEAKTKGIIMAIAGAIMIGLKSVLTAMGVI